MKLYLAEIRVALEVKTTHRKWQQVFFQVDPNLDWLVDNWKAAVTCMKKSPVYRGVKMQLVDGQWEVSYEEARETYIELEDMDELHNLMYEYGFTVQAVFVNDELAFKEIV